MSKICVWRKSMRSRGPHGSRRGHRGWGGDGRSSWFATHSVSAHGCFAVSLSVCHHVFSKLSSFGSFVCPVFYVCCQSLHLPNFVSMGHLPYLHIYLILLTSQPTPLPPHPPARNLSAIFLLSVLTFHRI